MSAPALHVTNGDSAAARLRPLLLGETLICWRDMLHDGPVPYGLTLAELQHEAVLVGLKDVGDRVEGHRSLLMK